MLKRISSILLLLSAAMPMRVSAAGNEIKITVTNPTSTTVSELVSATIPTITMTKGCSGLALYNAKGESVGYQAMGDAHKIVFPATIKASDSETFTLKCGKPQAVKPLTFGRLVPERTNDYAWETPFSAWRMYSTTLLPKEPNTSNGVDMWCKRTGSLMVDSLYDLHSRGGRYHNEQSFGGDGYQVGGKTLGCGGIAAFTGGNKLWLHLPFDTCYTVANGPYLTEFVLVYHKVEVDGDFYTKTLRITATSDGLLCKGVVKYEGKAKPMQLAAGLFLHKSTGGVPYVDRKGGKIAYAEKNSEGAWKTPVRYFEAVCFPQSSTTGFIFDNHLMLSADYTPNTEFTYYFGGTNSLNAAANMHSDAQWFDAVAAFSPASKLRVNVK